MNKKHLIFFILMLAVLVSADSSNDATTTTINILNEIFCKLIFILFTISSAIGILVITLEGIRWTASADDPGARKKAKDGIIHVFVGLVIVLLAIPLVTIVMVGSERFYACVFYGNSGSGGSGTSSSGTLGSGRISSMSYLGDGWIRYTTDLDLYEGWNLISVPFILNDTNLTRVFRGVDYDIVYSWNETAKHWDYYLPGVGGNLTTVEVDRGYWIHVNRNTTLSLLGVARNEVKNVTLVEGWNLVGYSGYHPLKLERSLESVKYMFAFSWNTTQAMSHSRGVGWEFGTPSRAYGLSPPPKPPLMMDPGYSSMENLTVMEAGRGYWVYVYKNSSWIYSTDYPD